MSPNPNNKSFFCRTVASGISFDPQKALETRTILHIEKLRLKDESKARLQGRDNVSISPQIIHVAEWLAIQALVFNFNYTAHWLQSLKSYVIAPGLSFFIYEMGMNIIVSASQHSS